MRNKEYSWYILANAFGFGVKSIHYIYENLQANNLSINDLFDLGMNDLQMLFPEIGRGKFARADFSCLLKLDSDNSICSNFEKLKSDGVTIIGLDDDRYPKSVLQNMADDSPSVLYCKGYLPLLNQRGVSIVGARDVSDFEITIAKKIAQKLSENAINVTSGYAKGVDTSAHIGALEAHGTTTMILSFGTNHITIKKELRHLNWERNTLFVTQFAPYEKFSGQNAMTRNKLVCAMSKAIVVIKSGVERDSLGKMSGTFDAGKSALKMGVPLFVLSPQILKPVSKGNADLIKLGGIEFLDEMEIINFLECSLKKEPIIANILPNNRGIDKNEKNHKSKKNYQTNLFDL